MNRLFLPSATALALFLAVPLPESQAASFDCAKAEEPDEIAVCNSPELSALDSEMASLWRSYKDLPLLMGESGAREDAARDFLDRRGECGSDKRCLHRVYKDRIRTLKRQINEFDDEQGFLQPTPGLPAPAIRTASRSSGEPSPGIFLVSDTSSGESGDLPKNVGTVIDGYAKECQQMGGKLADGDKPKILTGDLDGDSVDDYVINPKGMECSASATLFCPSGGCYIKVALSSKDFKDPTQIMGGDPKISEKQDGTVLDMSVDGVNCNTTNVEPCLGEYSWKDGTLQKHFESGKSD